MNSRMLAGMRVIGISLGVSLLLVTSVWTIPPAPVSFTVNTSFDSWDDNPGDGICDNGLGFCTLRAAVMEANRSAGNVTIELPAGTYILVGPVAGIDENTGDINLTTPVSGNPVITIAGADPATTIIDADGKDGVLTVDAGRTAIVGGVTLRNGNRIGFGGGIHNEGILTLTHVGVSDNHLNGAYAGGGIYNASQLGIYSSTISANSTESGYGGGISSVGGLTIVNSTIDGNRAFLGGALFNAGVVVAVNSTFSANHALRDGGAIYNSGSGVSNIYNATIVFNEADADANFVGVGAGIHNYPGAIVNIRNTVVADNYDSGVQPYDDCTGDIGMYGNNRFSPSGDCPIAAGSPGTATPLDSPYELGVLQNSGGPTETVALVPPSSMIGGGVACVDANSVHLAMDQRGRPRPPSPADPLSSTCDIGAFEYNEIFASEFDL